MYQFAMSSVTVINIEGSKDGGDAARVRGWLIWWTEGHIIRVVRGPHLCIDV